MNEADIDQRVLEVLRSLSGDAVVTLRSGKTYIVRNIAAGLDLGDISHHITTNVSPYIDGIDPEFFYTNEVETIRSGDEILFRLKT